MGGDRLGRGARPGRRRPRARHQRARPRRGRHLPRQPQRALASARPRTACAMVKTLRTRNRFSASSVDQIPHQLVAWQLYGHQLLLPIPDIDRTSYFLVFGANPMASNGSLMTVPDFPNRLRALKARGGRMVVFDPRRTETAKVADEHHFVRPGSDAVVVLAMVRTLFDEGLTRPAAVRRPGRPRARAASSRSPPRWPSRRQRHRRADDVRRLARELAAADGARGVRPDRRLHDRLRLAGAVGHPVPQHPDRQLRPAGRRAVHRAGHRLRGARAHRARATTTCGAAGSAGSRSTAASCRPR